MTVSTVSPWDELDPPQDDVVMMNSKGAVVMNIETLAKIATGQSPIKFDRLLDYDERLKLTKWTAIEKMCGRK